MNRNGLITVFVQRVIAATDYTELDETYLIRYWAGLGKQTIKHQRH